MFEALREGSGREATVAKPAVIVRDLRIDASRPVARTVRKSRLDLSAYDTDKIELRIHRALQACLRAFGQQKRQTVGSRREKWRFTSIVARLFSARNNYWH